MQRKRFNNLKQKPMDKNRISDVVFEGIDHRDAPDFVDSFVSHCLIDGRDATEKELEEINDDGDLKYDLLMDYLY